MTEKRKPRSESLLTEIRDLTRKVHEVRLELEELIQRPPDRPVWRILSSHGERSVAGDRDRGRERKSKSVEPKDPTAKRGPPSRKSNRPGVEADPGADPDSNR
jgi:hypothetical protein